MPLKLNVGLSRKIGQPRFGSRGASLNLELELDSAAIDAPDRLRERIRDVYGLLRVAIDEQLHSEEQYENDVPTSWGRPARCDRQNGEALHRADSTVRYATPGQVRALRAIARRKRIDLRQLVRERFDTEQIDDLSVRDASVLIDHLDAQPAVATS